MRRFTGHRPISTAGASADLGPVRYRSMWERNFARFLNYVGERFEYEPTTFWFKGIRRGTCSYKPDFHSMQFPHRWYEVKGHMDARSDRKSVV